MTDTPNPPASGQRERLGRPPRFLVLVAAAVLLVAAAWSAVWYAGTRKADALITAWLAAEAAEGRSYACGERGIGGYPFRVSVTCAAPVLDIADAEPRLRFVAEGFRAVAQVWDLTHVIFEIDGPVRLEADGPDVAFDADWTLFRGSLRAPGGEIRRLDIVATGLAATPDPATPNPAARGPGGVTVTAAEVEFHARRAEGGAAGARDIEAAVDARDLVIALERQPAPQPVDVAFVGRLDALPYPPPREPAAFLSAWRANGGAIDVARLSAAQGGTELRAAGRIVPDGAGRPEGRVTVSISGSDVATPGSAGAFGGIGPLIAMALRFVGKPTDIDGRAGLAGEIDFRDGRVVIGGMPIAELPPLF